MNVLKKMILRRWWWSFLSYFFAIKPKVVPTGKPGELYIEVVKLSHKAERGEIFYSTDLPRQMLRAGERAVITSIGVMAHPDIWWANKSERVVVTIDGWRCIDSTVLGCLGGLHIGLPISFAEPPDIRIEAPASLPIRFILDVITPVGV